MTIRMKTIKPRPVDEAFRNDAIELLRKHSGHLPAEAMLALGSHLVGQIIAMQDQRTMTREEALAIVTANIEKGNAEVMGNLMRPQGAS